MERAVPLWERVVAANEDAIPDRMLLASHFLAAGQRAEAAGLVQEIQAINPEYDVQMASRWLALAGATPVAIEQVAQGLRAAGLPDNSASAAHDPGDVPTQGAATAPGDET